jgi:hypothetical protein
MTVAKFTLRFRDPRTHEILGLLADRRGVSKNQLAEDLLGCALQAEALMLEHDLTGTLDLLRAYRREDHLEQAIADFAHAEGHERDPIRTRVIGTPRDVFGVADAFS